MEVNIHILIDSDSLAYGAGFVCNEPGQEALACYQADKSIQTILDDLQPSSYHLYLTGKGNFRFDFYPEYKANRSEMKKPLHLQVIREHLEDKWQATVTHGIEADDAVGIAQYTAHDETCIVGIDKDLLMIPGQHYNFRKKELRSVSNEEGFRHFCWQLMMGDRTDNIPGYDGKMRLTVPKFLQQHADFLEQSNDKNEMLAHVASMYGDWERFHLSARCLWIQRVPDDSYLDWFDPELLEELRVTYGPDNIQ